MHRALLSFTRTQTLLMYDQQNPDVLVQARDRLEQMTYERAGYKCVDLEIIVQRLESYRKKRTIPVFNDFLRENGLSFSDPQLYGIFQKRSVHLLNSPEIINLLAKALGCAPSDLFLRRRVGPRAPPEGFYLRGSGGQLYEVKYRVCDVEYTCIIPAHDKNSAAVTIRKLMTREHKKKGFVESVTRFPTPILREMRAFRTKRPLTRDEQADALKKIALAKRDDPYFPDEMEETLDDDA
jgi:hypothetical protein